MLRVNGLFGWMELNDRRSLTLFGGFLLAFHVAATLALYFPLAAFDPEHAPVYGWMGYLVRYVPAVTVAAAVVFALQMAWHVNSVRKLVAFAFVDDRDEPRLCAIVEPLAIQMGLPVPYVGVIDSPALNAFACGVRAKDAVVVVTRGLIDGLDDEELAAVVAHELAHIARGDIRLMAAANVCLNMLGQLMRPRMKRTSRLQELASLPILTVLMPPMLVFVLIVSVIAQSAMRAGQLVRMLISTSREFVADALAVETTQNPAALVSALEKIRGRSRIAGMSPGQDAMMIAGDADGPLATHPQIAARIKAIVAVTGSMALIAPSRRDTRAPAARGSFGRRVRTASAPEAAVAAVARDERNWLGLTRDMTIGVAIALAAFVAVNAGDLRTPGKLVAALDPRPINTFIAITARGVACSVNAMVPTGLGAAYTTKCAPGAMDAFIAENADKAGVLGVMLGAMKDRDGTFEVRSGGRPN